MVLSINKKLFLIVFLIINLFLARFKQLSYEINKLGFFQIGQE